MPVPNKSDLTRVSEGTAAGVEAAVLVVLPEAAVTATPGAPGTFTFSLEISPGEAPIGADESDTLVAALKQAQNPRDRLSAIRYYRRRELLTAPVAASSSGIVISVVPAYPKSVDVAPAGAFCAHLGSKSVIAIPPEAAITALTPSAGCLSASTTLSYRVESLSSAYAPRRDMTVGAFSAFTSLQRTVTTSALTPKS